MTQTSADPMTPGERPAWKDADHEQRRELIVDAALALLHEDGPDAVTIRGVAGRLNVGAMTLYTYFDGQHELRRSMTRRGFEMLQSNCQSHSTLEDCHSWRGGAVSYISFALENPNLYRLMFDTPMPAEDHDLLHGGFQPLLDKVRERLAAHGHQPPQLDRLTRTVAGRYWIGLHGLATLAIAGRLDVLEGDLEDVLDDLLEHVAPPT